MVLTGKSGGRYTLEQKPFSSGGEGDIYRIVGNSSRVAKIYHPDRITRELEEKLTLMTQKQPNASVLNQVAWPLDTIYENGRFRGFVMPKLDITAELSEVYVYPPKSNITYEQKLILAQNICVVIHAVHQAGYVFGDFNPRNIGVNLKTGTVAFLDTDSYHIVVDRARNKAYRCGVCAPGYCAPELLTKCANHIAAHPEDKSAAYARVPLDTFTRETDNFALAIHMFRLLMNGYTPFNGIANTESASVGSPGVGDQAVKRDSYCFKPGNKPQAVAVPPLSALPDGIAKLFTRAFIDGRKDPSRRPSALEWHKALEAYEGELKKCSRNPAHMYRRGLLKCPWCEADERYKKIMAPPPVQQKTFTSPVVTAPPPVTRPPVTPQPVVRNPGYTATAVSQTTPAKTPWRNRTPGPERRKLAGVLRVVGWIAFVGSILFLASHFLQGGSIRIDDYTLRSFDVRRGLPAALAGVFLLSLGCNAWSGSGYVVSGWLGGILGAVFSFGAGAVTTMQLEYGGGAMWEYMAIYAVYMASGIVLGDLAGAIVRKGLPAVVRQNRTQVHKYSVMEFILIGVMVVGCGVSFWLFRDLYQLFYVFFQNEKVLYFMVGVPVLVVLLYVLAVRDRGLVTDVWLYAFVSAAFLCCLIWAGRQSGWIAVLGWVGLGALALLYMANVMQYTDGAITAAAKVLMVIMFIAGALMMWSFHRGMGGMTHGLYLLTVGPVLVNMAMATSVTAVNFFLGY